MHPKEKKLREAANKRRWWRIQIFFASAIAISFAIFGRHWIWAIGCGSFLGFAALLVWDAVQSRKELGRMAQQADFKVWYDQVRSRARQFGIGLELEAPADDSLHAYFSGGLTPDEAWEKIHARVERAAEADPILRRGKKRFARHAPWNE